MALALGIAISRSGIMAENSGGKITWRGLEVDPAALASANLALTGQLLAFLVRRGRLTKAEAAEIIGAAVAAGKHGGIAAAPGDDRDAQSAAILQLLQNDVIR